MTRQAIQLGWLPPLKITQTSAEGYGQIYVGIVNWMLMLVTLGLAIGFGKSDNLAAAYGIAVSATMLITSMLLFIAMREIWGWSLVAAGAVAGVFVTVDAGFLHGQPRESGLRRVCAARLGGGRLRHNAHLASRSHCGLHPASRAGSARRRLHGGDRGAGQIPRVPGAAVFLTRTQRDAPPVMVWHLKHNRALHERLFVLTVNTEPIPWVQSSERLAIEEIAPRFWRASARYGFMERPDIPALLRQACEQGCAIDLADVTYYVGHETVTPRDDAKALPRWVEAVFALMQRNSAHLTDYFKLPPDAVVEIRRQISI